MRIHLLLVMTGLLSSCSSTPRALTDAELSRVVASVSQSRAHMVRRFDGPGGLTGVVVEGNDPGSRQAAGWVTSDGKYLLIGNLFDQHGHDVADGHLNHPGWSAATERGFFQRVQTAEAVSQFPTGTRTLYVFADADCVFCWKLFEEMSQSSESFKVASVRVHWIMVGTQSVESARRGAEILRRGLAGLVENETGYSTVQHVGGIAPLGDPKFIDAISENTELFLQSPTTTRATPTLVWASPRGAQLRVGLPDEGTLQQILSEIQPDSSQP